MQRPLSVLLVAALVVTPVTSLAQDRTAAAQRPQSPQAVLAPLPEPADPVRKSDLGISLGRIRRELREVPPAPRDSTLRYDFHVDVYGENPKVDFFKDFDLSPGGAVKYGGMTHAEFLNVTTPQAYRAQGGSLIGLAAFAIGQLAKKTLKPDKSQDK
jgi:hypothetical protein